MKEYNYTYRELDDSRILDLRVIARELGVDRPTTMDKSTLIEKILLKQEAHKRGEVQVKTSPARGRPPKRALVSPMMLNPQPSSTVVETKVSEPAAVYQEPAPRREYERPAIEPADPYVPYERPVHRQNDFQRSQPSQYNNSRRSQNSRDGYSSYNNRDDRSYSPREERNYTPREERNYVPREERTYAPREERTYTHREERVPAHTSYEDYSGDDKKEIVEEQFPIIIKEGVLEIMSDGYGFLRANNCEPGDGDAYIAAPRIKRCGLRKGDYIKAETRKQTEHRPGGVINVLEVNGRVFEGTPMARKSFDSLTPIYPDSRLRLEIPSQKNDFAIRAIDLISPIGKGQRAMIVSPPKAGKTTLLKKIANSISANYPQVSLFVLLIDERPEEVTDMQRSIKGEVVYSTFDEVPEHHTRAAEMVLERAKRLVELGEDVVILMDSLTRLARAYNLVVSPSGRTLSGGIDPGALHNPKRFFGAARNIENGGSLTIIATALVDTGSRMDDVIYEEFKGTGNMEIHLDRKLSEKRIFPAIDLNRSGTRREEILLDQKEIEAIWGMRKMLSNGENADATETLINMLVKTSTNREFVEQLRLQLATLKAKGYTVR